MKPRQGPGPTEQKLFNRLGLNLKNITEDVSGLKLPEIVLERLDEAFICARSEIILAQNAQDRSYVLCGADSGGSNGEFGHVVGFAPSTNFPEIQRESFNNVIPNRTHSFAISNELVRFEVYRSSHTYSVGMALFSIPLNSQTRPAISRRDLFLYVNGKIERDDSLPIFRATTGEQIQVPTLLCVNVQTMVEASRCNWCVHSHANKLGPVLVRPT